MAVCQRVEWVGWSDLSIPQLAGDFHLQTQETHVAVQALQQGGAGVSVFYFSVYE
jgi:hypothetical protein